ncbi:hypothetical protein [Reinekea sp. G2M2-21]|uniref:hypothetical protein n=1 Tax=Reinekea sp. G2M2-21 TaxID=2788942 RepID=UPI0018AA8E59|nr:hypothetical protein [Reinekea sp. G2M2-21]
MHLSVGDYRTFVSLDDLLAIALHALNANLSGQVGCLDQLQNLGCVWRSYVSLDGVHHEV